MEVVDPMAIIDLEVAATAAIGVIDHQIRGPIRRGNGFAPEFSVGAVRHRDDDDRPRENGHAADTVLA